MTKEIRTHDAATDHWGEFDRAMDELRSRVFDSFGIRTFAFPYVSTGASELAALRAARVDVTDTGPGFRIVAEIPGIPKENLDIRVRGNTVEIRGEHAKEAEKEGAEYLHRERTYCGYYRTLELSEPVVVDKATAKVTNGLLELELPKQHPEPTPAETKIRVE